MHTFVTMRCITVSKHYDTHTHTDTVSQIKWYALSGKSSGFSKVNQNVIRKTRCVFMFGRF